ncbi:MAG: DNA-processing protein DprA [Eubacterium sp.]|nr:DNA-processing protein DprA [Eubacterium sp.]
MRKNNQSRENRLEMWKIRRDDPAYPEKLRAYARMPEELYVIGRLPDPAGKCVAIVGARRCSNYGYSEAKRFGKVLAEHGVQVISGMALGCDAAGHEGALEGGGRTFAVLGSGADVCYPSSNRLLYEQILRTGGGILSEFEPGTPAAGWHFPIRNRIISALSDLVLVAEARRKSGSLITVEYALEQGKAVYAIPGRNRDPASAGCNHLISEGAGIATCPEDILAELGLSERTGDSGKGSGYANPSSDAALIPESGVDLKPASGAGVKLPSERASGAGTKRSAEPASESVTKRSSEPASESAPGIRAGNSVYLSVRSALDFDEQSAFAIAAKAGCTEAEAGRYLLELCAERYAREVLPGCFCRC